MASSSNEELSVVVSSEKSGLSFVGRRGGYSFDTEDLRPLVFDKTNLGFHPKNFEGFIPKKLRFLAFLPCGSPVRLQTRFDSRSVAVLCPAAIPRSDAVTTAVAYQIFLP